MEHYHSVLKRHINKHLPQEYKIDDSLRKFLDSINKSFFSFDRDRELLEHSFVMSEKEFTALNQELNDSLKVQEEALSKLKATVTDLTKSAQKEDGQVGGEEDLVGIADFINSQTAARIEMETSLKRSNSLLETLMKNLHAGVLVENKNREIVFTNDYFCELFGIPMTPRDMIGMDCSAMAAQSKDHFLHPNSVY